MTEPQPAWTPPTPPDIGPTGTRPAYPEAYASAVLRVHGEAIAAEVARRFYEVWPELLARYGERGRQHTLEDQYWHLSTLDTALGLDDPATFLGYVAWLRGFLAGRGMGDDIAGANFAFLVEAVERLALPAGQEDERIRVLDYLRRALATFPEEARTPPGR
jgi:hypothetical protein